MAAPDRELIRHTIGTDICNNIGMIHVGPAKPIGTYMHVLDRKGMEEGQGTSTLFTGQHKYLVPALGRAVYNIPFSM